jgi:hypothetical protein
MKSVLPCPLRGILLAVAGLLAVATPGRADGFFHVAEEAGRSWLVDPDGRHFFSTGVNLFHSGDDPAIFDPANPAYSALRQYDSFDTWYAQASGRLSAWGFNTLGAWTANDVLARADRPYTVALHLGQYLGAPWVDVDTDAARATIGGLVDLEVRPRRDDPRLIGYFVDNELCWCEPELFAYWARRPQSAPIKRKLFALLRREYGGDLARVRRDFEIAPAPRRFEALADALETFEVRPGRRPAVVDAFVEMLADDYYRVVSAAVRAADPHHLLLGDRYAAFYSQPAARAAGRYMDVVSVNDSPLTARGFVSPSFFATLHRLSGRPVLVSEFYAAAAENQSGNHNQHGPYLVVDTQAQRADVVATMTETLARLPYVVGYHWFQWSDQPAGGRGDGEDFNMGLVDLRDGPYDALTAAFTKANAGALARHAEGVRAWGLQAGAGVWSVPASRAPLDLDGRLDEWELAGAWAPEPRARAPYLPFGDFYLSWRPEGLVVGVSYHDYAASAVDVRVVNSRRRLALAVARDGGRTVRETLLGLNEHEPGATGRALLPLAPARRGAAAVRGAQRVRNLLTTAEVLVPADALGPRRLRAGDRLRLHVTLTLQGGKELRWPASGDAALVLDGGDAIRASD